MFSSWLKVLLVTVLIAYCAGGERDHPRLPKSRAFVPKSEEQTTKFWIDKAQDILSAKLSKFGNTNTNRAKNIILFLGDGMSVHTVTATRSFLGDASKQVFFEKFPYVGLSKTYSVDMRVPDSAVTSTAYLNGVKANYGTIGVNALLNRRECAKSDDPFYHTESLAKWAQDAGKWAGLVTTARVTHASPAGVYAHTSERNWENDAKIEEDGCSAADTTDIARQLVEWPVGRNLRVILGGGRRNFRDESVNDEEGLPGKRTDNRDLIAEWLADKQKQGVAASYVWYKNGLKTLDYSKTEYLLGLFSTSHCPYHGDLKRDDLEHTDPSLSEMTEAAIKVLSKKKEGYFLFVEGARIDMAHHDTRARRSLEETAEFARAVELARQMTSEEDTLIVVTSDHSHTMTINGYPNRGEDILGLAPEIAADDLPYTILSYANGPGYDKTYSKKGRKDLGKADLTNPKYKYPATAPLESETHGGDDVAVFASGPYEHYFTGNYEQSNIPALMAHAANIGPFAKVVIDDPLYEH